MAIPDCALYQPRQPQATPLYHLVASRYADVRDGWGERFESRYGFWRAAAERAVGAYLDCGILDHGFARVRCGKCRAEYLVAFSCKGRGLCPSCAAKRAAALAAFLREEVLAGVGHAQWVFSIPKMLRPYFLYHRPLLGRLCRAAYETARAMIAAASRDGEQLLPGMIAVVQTFGDDLTSVTVPPDDGAGLERLARYLVRPPVSLERLHVDEQARAIAYARRPGHGIRTPASPAPLDPDEFLARVLMHIPEPRLHLIRYYGAYSSVVRARRRRAQAPASAASPAGGTAGPEPADDPDLRALRHRWAELIRRIYEVDPLVCPRCGGTMRIIAFITQPKVIATILAHLAAKAADGRSPPGASRNQRPAA